MVDDAVTDWSTMTVEQMWSMVGDHDSTAGWTQSTGWQRTFELLDQHHGRVKQYRDDLAAKWTSTPGSAAEAFLAKVDEMLDSMQKMRDAAMANGPAVSHINASLTEAQAKLAPVYQQWSANQAKLAGGQPQPAAGPSPAPAPSPGPPAISPTQQSQLHAQAVTIMSALSRHTVEGTRAIKTPPPYEPPSSSPISQYEPDNFASTSAHSHSGASSSRSSTAATGVPSAYDSDSRTSLSGAPSPGLITRPAAPPLAGAPGSLGGPGVSPIGGIIGYVPPVLGVGGPLQPEGFRSGGPQRTSGAPRVNPRGGVIGGPQEPTERSPGATSLRRVNPAGGVIGPKSGQEAGMVGGGPMGGGRLGDQRRRSRNAAYDTDDDWPVPTGVPPILLPPDEPIHEPGPILGLNP